MSIQFIHLHEKNTSLISYEKMWETQKRVVEKVSIGEMPSTVFFLEHESVITRGKGKQQPSTSLARSTASQNEIEPQLKIENYMRHSPDPVFKNESNFENKIPIIDIDRGGDLTWHGEGQLVIYPILKLDGISAPFHDVEKVIRLYEKCIIDLCAEYGLRAFAKKDETGVWVNVSQTLETEMHKKIASIGIGVRKWTTFHGIALNVDNTLDVFQTFSPCGYKSEVMTSLKALSLRGLINESLLLDWRSIFLKKLSVIFLKNFAPKKMNNNYLLKKIKVDHFLS